MANQPLASGLSAQVKKKIGCGGYSPSKIPNKLNETADQWLQGFLMIEGKRDRDQEAQALEWIEAILGTNLDRSKPYEDILRDGVILCKLINKIKPGSVKKINENSTMPFKIMENINAFQEAIKAYGVPTADVFQTVDLFEKKDISQVTQCIFALGRTCQTHSDYDGPTLGPKLAQENKREFTEEQLREGANVISLQYGTNKGASQAGMTMGKQRMIID